MRKPFLSISAAALICGVLVSSAAAGGKGRECKPGGAPSPFGEVGPIASAQPVDYWSEAWLLVTDKLTKPDKVRLIGGAGQIVEIGKPPSTVEPAYWLARGRAVYALGKGRSQTAGKVDLVLMRWGSDPRPRLTVLHTTDAIEGQLSAAFTNEFLAVSWAQKGTDGKLHRMASFLDSEELRVPVPQDLGLDSGGAARAQSVAKGFTLLWGAENAVMRAGFDQHGKPVAPAVAVAWAGPVLARALVQCEERVWVVHEAANELVLSSGEVKGAISELVRLPAPPGPDLIPMYCVDDGVAIGRRMLSAKADNITFWISTVDALGKVRERRIKDIHGSADDIRSPQFVAAGGKLTGWWLEGQGDSTRLWSRAISCE